MSVDPGAKWPEATGAKLNMAKTKALVTDEGRMVNKKRRVIKNEKEM